MSQSRGKFLVLSICLMLVFNKVKGQAPCSTGDTRLDVVFFCPPASSYASMAMPETVICGIVSGTIESQSSVVDTGTCILATAGNVITATLNMGGAECIASVTSCVATAATVTDNGSPEGDDSD